MTDEQRQQMIAHWREIGRVFAEGRHRFGLCYELFIRGLWKASNELYALEIPRVYSGMYFDPLVPPGTPDYPRAHFAWLMAEILEQGE